MWEPIQLLNGKVGFVFVSMGPSLGLAKTRDGGTTWQRMTFPVDHVTALRFIDEHVGWAIGAGVVLRTQDGGVTWQPTLSTEGSGVRGDPLRQLQAVDGRLAWVLVLAEGSCSLTCPAELRRTTDAGQTWTILLRGNIAAIRFASANRGWVSLVEPNGTVDVRTTSDGGTTWTIGQRVSMTSWPPTLDAATTQSAWLMTGDSTSCSASTCGHYELFRTDDGGTSWSRLGNPKDSAGNCAFGFLVGPLFASTIRGWLGLNFGAGGGTGPVGLLMTEDGGKTWRCVNTPPNNEIVSAADPLHVWVLSTDRLEGRALSASDDGGTTWHRVTLGTLS